MKGAMRTHFMITGPLLLVLASACNVDWDHPEITNDPNAVGTTTTTNAELPSGGTTQDAPPQDQAQQDQTTQAPPQDQTQQPQSQEPAQSQDQTQQPQQQLPPQYAQPQAATQTQ